MIERILYRPEKLYHAYTSYNELQVYRVVLTVEKHTTRLEIRKLKIWVLQDWLQNFIHQEMLILCLYVEW